MRSIPRCPGAPHPAYRSGTPDAYAAYRVAILAGHYHRAGERQPVVWLAERADHAGAIELIATGIDAVPAEAETSPVGERGIWQRLERHAA